MLLRAIPDVSLTTDEILCPQWVTSSDALSVGNGSRLCFLVLHSPGPPKALEIVDHIQLSPHYVPLQSTKSGRGSAGTRSVSNTSSAGVPHPNTLVAKGCLLALPLPGTTGQPKPMIFKVDSFTTEERNTSSILTVTSCSQAHHASKLSVAYLSFRSKCSFVQGSDSHSEQDPQACGTPSMNRENTVAMSTSQVEGEGEMVGAYKRMGRKACSLVLNHNTMKRTLGFWVDVDTTWNTAWNIPHQGKVHRKADERDFVIKRISCIYISQQQSVVRWEPVQRSKWPWQILQTGSFAGRDRTTWQYIFGHFQNDTGSPHFDKRPDTKSCMWKQCTHNHDHWTRPASLSVYDA